MAGMLELLGWEFKTTMIKMLGALMDKADSVQEQMGNVNREMPCPSLEGSQDECSLALSRYKCFAVNIDLL